MSKQKKSSIEFLGLWEQLNNPDFNPIEFDGIKKQAGLPVGRPSCARRDTVAWQNALQVLGSLKF